MYMYMQVGGRIKKNSTKVTGNFHHSNIVSGSNSRPVVLEGAMVRGIPVSYTNIYVFPLVKEKLRL